MDTQTEELSRKFNIYLANKTFEYFKKNKEFKNKYLENPLDFYKNFKNIVDKFEIYTRKERLELIERKLLNLKNTEVYNLLGDYIEEYDFATLLKKDNESKVKILDDLINWSKGLEDIEKLRQIDFDIAEKEYRKKRYNSPQY